MVDKINKQKLRVMIIVTELKKLFPDAKIVLHYANNWELLVSVILSAQCTDKMVNKVTEKNRQCCFRQCVWHCGRNCRRHSCKKAFAVIRFNQKRRSKQN